MTSGVSSPRRLGVLVGLLILTLSVGAIGGFVTADSVRTWYPTLHQPAWTPPNGLFAPVWTTLYVLIAIAGWRLYLERPRDDHRARTLWWGQLVLNGLWTPVFFGAHLIGVAAAIITALWFVITFFILITWRPERLSGVLFMPYWAWITYAASLNFALWWMN
ncbi:MAG: TspO/MBR family protein [Acidobacteriota bacterium]